jgi:hypothetical protein
MHDSCMPIYSGLTLDFDMPDLKETEALLDEIRE